jgi:drug/metabolite transporter (DMT)-like permease
MSSDIAVVHETGHREVRAGLLFAVLLLGIWAGYILLTRFGVRTSFAPADLLALRVGIGALVVLPWFVKRGFGGLNLVQALALALTAGIGFSAFSFVGFLFAPVSHASALQTATLPLFTAVLAVVVLKERFMRAKALGLALIVAGVGLLAYESLSKAETGQWRGDICFAAASFDWAIYSILAQRWRVTPRQASGVVYVMAALLYLPLYALFFPHRLLDAPLGELAVQAVLQGILSNVVSLFAFTRVVQAFGASSTAMLAAASPLMVTVLAIPLLGEIPTALAWAGLILMTFGIVATVLVLQPRRSPG